MADDGKKPGWMAETKVAPDGIPGHAPPPAQQPQGWGAVAPPAPAQPQGWGQAAAAPPPPPPQPQPQGWGPAAAPPPPANPWAQPAPQWSPQPAAPQQWSPPTAAPQQWSPQPAAPQPPQPVAAAPWTPAAPTEAPRGAWIAAGGLIALALFDLARYFFIGAVKLDTGMGLLRAFGGVQVITGAVIAFGLARLAGAWSDPTARGAGYVAAAMSGLRAMLSMAVVTDPINYVRMPGQLASWLGLGALVFALVAVAVSRRGRGLGVYVIIAMVLVALNLLHSVIAAAGDGHTFPLRAIVAALARVSVGLALALSPPMRSAIASVGAPELRAAGRVDLGSYLNLYPLAVLVALGDCVFFGVVFAVKSEGAEIAAAFVASTALAIWAALAARNARALGAGQLRFSPFIAFLTQIFPLANILGGSYVFQELWQRSYGATAHPPSRLIKVTFRFIIFGFLASILVQMLLVGMITSSQGGPLNPAALLPLYLVQLVVASGFVMRIVACFRITGRQADASRRLRVQA